MPTLRPSALAMLSALTMGCRTGATGQALRPTEATAWEATGDVAGQCRAVSSFGEPLVVDWEAHQRANIEEAMHDGVAVVAYDCKSLRLLKGCRLDGSYGFMAVSKKEQVIRFENADEVAANLPAFGLPLVRQLRGDLTRDSTLDLAMILVGKKRTTVSSAGREKLLGGAACEGATHFVRGAFVGAFTMGTGTRGEASLGVGLFSAASRSSKLSKYRDGEAETCQQARPGDSTAPATCGALLRLELVGLEARAAGSAGGPSASKDKSEEKGVEEVCSAGLVLTAGKCARPRATETHQCKEGDVNDCQEQCDRGHPGSCTSLGFLHERGQGVTVDMGRAASLYQKGCEEGIARGCTNLGVLYNNGQGVTVDMGRAASLYQKGCEGGRADGCTYLGLLYQIGQGVTVDMGRAASLYQRGCDGGSADGCTNLGLLYQKGQGVTVDRGRAASLYQRGCDGGSAAGCSYLGDAYESGHGVTVDRGRAASLYQKGCDGGSAVGCTNLGVLYNNGQGVTVDMGRAASLYQKGCDGGSAAGCTNLGLLYQIGQGVTVDMGRAASLYQKGCEGGSADGCTKGVALLRPEG